MTDDVDDLPVQLSVEIRQIMADAINQLYREVRFGSQRITNQDMMKLVAIRLYRAMPLHDITDFDAFIPYCAMLFWPYEDEPFRDEMHGATMAYIDALSEGHQPPERLTHALV